MSDTVKLIIKLPKKTVARIRSNYGHGCKGIYDGDKDKIVNAVYHGIPFDDVKAEIDKAQEPYITSTAYDEGVRFGLMLAYQIVDRCKAESEEE